MTMIKTTTLHYPIQNFKQPVRQVVAMGFFDGVHLGHQAVIKRAKAEADALGVPLAVLTYDPHPSIAFKALTEPLKYLTVVKQKAQLLETLGVSEMYKMQFTSQLAGLSPQVFVDEVLMQLNPVAVVAGFDHLYGSDKNQANMANLAIYAKARFDVIIVPEFDDLGLKIGSSKIRSALCVGDMQTVNRQLGRIYHTTGIVVHGEARGRELGFPTANVLTPELEWLPGIGIYAVKISIAGNSHSGMASVG